MPDAVLEKENGSASLSVPEPNNLDGVNKEIAAAFDSDFSWTGLLDATADVYNGVRWYLRRLRQPAHRN